LNGEITVGVALAAFRAKNGLCQNERQAQRWLLKIGFFLLPLPNFSWRKRAIDAHDTHHMLTGYPCTVAGELQIAAWEFGAGRYPHWGATLFCVPMVVVGLMLSPGDVWSAFQRGQRERSLYSGAILDRLLSCPLSEAREWIANG
jgi:hypothetical protein